MNKIALIIQREYLTRVKKKSFIIMTLIGPVLMAAIMIIPIWLTTMQTGDDKLIGVIDKTQSYQDVLKNTENMAFAYLSDASLDSLKKNFNESPYYAILYIPVSGDSIPQEVSIFSEKQPSIDVKMHISDVLEKEIERRKLKKMGIKPQVLNDIESKVEVSTIRWKESGEAEKSSTEIYMAIGFISAFLIYMFIFFYGAQVMRGIIEEKTNRVVEIIISSVRPFQLMMGKIVGIALVALTQFMLWVILTFLLVSIASVFFIGDMQTTPMTAPATDTQMVQMPDTGNQEINQVLGMIQNIPFGQIVIGFIFYFLGGYLLYASLFAAIGSAVDSEADTQQFMLPVTIPLILAIMVAQPVVASSGEGPLAFWFSIIPFTSPVIMMIRIPFEVPVWQLILSIALLILTFIGSTWMAGKIYRTGILMYGKKISYKELWKWLKYRN